MKYKMAAMCDNCPFATEGAGLQLRLSLGKERWVQIKTDLVKGGHFLCHKSTTMEEDEDGNYISDGTEKICAGARHYQATLGIVSDCEQVMERVLQIQKER